MQTEMIAFVYFILLLIKVYKIELPLPTPSNNLPPVKPPQHLEIVITEVQIDGVKEGFLHKTFY